MGSSAAIGDLFFVLVGGCLACWGTWQRGTNTGDLSDCTDGFGEGISSYLLLLHLLHELTVSLSHSNAIVL